MGWATILKILLLGLVPPSIWRLARGSRLASKTKSDFDRRSVDRDDFLWEVCMTAATLSLVGFMLVASGLLPFIGNGYVLAADIDKKVKLTTEARVAQLEQKIEQTASETKQTAEVAKDMRALLLDNLTEGTQAKIRSQLLKRCKISGAAEREEINKEKEKLQRQHLLYTGQRYAEPRCEEL